MYNKILVPLDGSLRAEQALALVSNYFADVELILLETTGDMTQPMPVYAAGHSGYIQPLPEVKKMRNDEYISQMKERTGSWATQVRGYSLVGPPAPKIVEIAENEQVDLIVMVTHGYDRFERILFGSVTEKVIRDAPCPVLAIRDDDLPKHMLIALDGTPFAEEILEPAIKLATQLKIDVTLARVNVPKDVISARDLDGIRSIDRELADVIVANHSGRSEIYLDSIRQRFISQLDGIDIKVDYDVAYGRPDVQLAEIAIYNECDLIAMTTHGRKGLQHLLKGSMTEKVMHRTDVAMLILHPDLDESK